VFLQLISLLKQINEKITLKSEYLETTGEISFPQHFISSTIGLVVPLCSCDLWSKWQG